MTPTKSHGDTVLLVYRLHLSDINALLNGTFATVLVHLNESKTVTKQCESKKSRYGYLNFFIFFHKRLRPFNRFCKHLLCVPMYARLQIFIQLSPTLTKLCHIKRDYPVHIICAKCPPSAETHTFRRLRKSLIALLMVVCGK